MRTFKAGADPCPLLGVKQTSAGLSPMSAFDPYRPFALRPRCDAAIPIIYSIILSAFARTSPAAQPLRHQHNGLAVDLGVIPLTHRHLEIRRARGKRRACLPAIGLE